MPNQSLRSINKHLSVALIPGKEHEKTARTLSPEKRKKLEEFRENQTLKVKADQLKNILIRKLCLKYGKINYEVIEKIVKDQVTSSDKVTNRVLELIEKQIEDQTTFRKQTPKVHPENDSLNNSLSSIKLLSEEVLQYN
jgi:hypothetical protein